MSIPTVSVPPDPFVLWARAEFVRTVKPVLFCVVGVVVLMVVVAVVIAHG